VSAGGSREAELRRGVARLVRWGLDPRVVAAVEARTASGAAPEEAWTDAGRRWSTLAVEALAAGHPTTAGLWAAQAFWCHRAVDARILDDAGAKRRAHERALTAMAIVTATWPAPRPRAVAVPWRGVDLPGLLLLPPGAAPSAPVPGVLALIGADGNKEEHLWATLRPLAARGVAAVVVDLPGHGWTRRVLEIPAAPGQEDAVAAAITVLGEQPEVDAARLGLLGSSLGGYLAPRAFAADGRVRACAVNSAVHDLAEGFWDPCPAIRPQLGYVLGADDGPEGRRRAAGFAADGALAGLDRPMRVYHGARDRMIPPSQAEAVCAEAGPSAELVMWPDAGHNLGNVGLEAQPRMWDWLIDHLTGRRD
jgi:dipeptidyl aminopeptidase/acylaminoacyl peptidase